MKFGFIFIGLTFPYLFSTQTDLGFELVEFGQSSQANLGSITIKINTLENFNQERR